MRTTVRSILGEDQKIPMTDDEGRKFPLLATDAYQQLSTMLEASTCPKCFDQSIDIILGHAWIVIQIQPGREFLDA